MHKITTLRSAPSGGHNGKQGRMPHVLLVIDQFPRTLGGGERVALRLAGLLPKYGFQASILTFSAHPESEGLKSPPCAIFLLPLHRTYDLDAIRAVFELRRFLEEERVQIVQTFFESSDLWGGCVTKLMSSAKLIWSRRDMGILRGRKHWIAYRLMAGLPDRVFAVSDQVRRHCIEVDHVEPDRTETIYNGLNLSDWSVIPHESREHDELVVATIGNIRRVKGHDILVRAVALVASHFPSVIFRVGGDVLEPEYFVELQELVRELGVADRIQFTGGVTDLRRYLTEADIFVLPSRSEGFSNAIIEAMAASLPVVATDVGGNAEAVENGVNGYIVPPEDPSALAAAIMRLLADRQRLLEMGASGRRTVAKRFTTEAMMLRTVEAYDGLLGKHSSRPS